MSWGDKEWKPTPKQAAFLSIPTTVKEALYGGGVGSGKTDVLLMYGIVHKWHENPAFKQVFMRRTRPDMKKEVVGRARDIYTKFGATYNGTDMIFTFPRPDQAGGTGMANAGAQIFLAHCEEEKDVHNFDSMEISLFTPDELTNSTEFIYLYLTFQRNRAPQSSGLPSITRAAGMPGGIGHTFTYKRFVKPAPEGNVIIQGRGGNKRIYIHSTVEDNKDHIDPTYIQSLHGIPSEAERKAKLYGDWTSYLGSVFDELRDKHFPEEPDNAIHVVEPFNIPSWWPKFIVGDWGYTALCYIAFYAISPSKRVYVYREMSWLKTKISSWAPVVKNMMEYEGITRVKFCQSASQQRGQDQTIQQQIEEELGCPIDLSVNSSGSRIAGKMLVHEYLRFIPKPSIPASEIPIYSEEHALWLRRNKSEQEYTNYLKLFEPEVPETNIPRLQIFRCSAEGTHEGHPNCCQQLIDALKACSYPNSTKDGKPVEDVAEFSGDDPYDNLRYGLAYSEQFFDEASEEFRRVQKEATIIQQLELNQDWTAYYRNMRTVESSQSLTPVKRYHKGHR